MITVVDTGAGNLRSVVRALEEAARRHGGALSVAISARPEDVARASRVVIPGQGAFGDCTRALARDGGALGQAVKEAIARGVPYLGICLGLQVLFESSEEAPGCAGLGVLPGTVRRFARGLRDTSGAALKVPHVGWNQAEACTDAARALLGAGGWYYFVHSYFVVPREDGVVAARTEHGAVFASAVARDNLLAVQFHPEKSQRAGLEFLARWLDAR
jgi:glutamine amidotransferase